MIALLATFWKPIAAIVAMLALAAFVIVAKHRYDESRRDEGRVEIRAEWNLDIARRVKLTTDMTNLWNDKRQEKEHDAEVFAAELAKRSAVAAERARNLPASVAGIRVPALARSVLDDAIDASNSAFATKPAGEPVGEVAGHAETPALSVGQWEEWSVQCNALYEQARGMVIGWQLFYSSLRAAQ